MAAILEPGETILCKARISWVACIIALSLLLAFMATGQISGLLTTELMLTNKRLLGRRGLLLRRNIAILHKDIHLIKVKRGFLGSVFDYGSLVILNRDGNKIVFRGICEPDDIKIQIEEAVEIAVLGHTISDYAAEKF